MLLWFGGGPKTQTFNRLFLVQYCIKLCVYFQPANLRQGLTLLHQVGWLDLHTYPSLLLADVLCLGHGSPKDDPVKG